MVVEEAAEHPEPTTIMGAVVAIGFFIHCKLVVEPRTLILNELGGLVELR